MIVEDTGSQMNKADIDRLFKGQNHLMRGLELQICKNIINQMEGSINFLSEPGVGNLFQINIETAIGEVPKVSLDQSFIENGNKLYACEIPSSFFKICEVENYQLLFQKKVGQSQLEFNFQALLDKPHSMSNIMDISSINPSGRMNISNSFGGSSSLVVRKINELLNSRSQSLSPKFSANNQISSEQSKTPPKFNVLIANDDIPTL